MTQATKCFSEVQVALMLGVPRATLRHWRVRNQEAGRLQYGPQYEYQGTDAVYPASAFRVWMAAMQVEDGAVRYSGPAVPLPSCPQGDPLATAPANNDDSMIALALAAQ